MSIRPGMCFVCREALDIGPVVTIKERGIRTLIEVSEKRGLKDNKKFLQVCKEVRVHDACRKRYTAVCNVEASVRRGGDSASQPQVSSTRSSTEIARTLKGICFLCGDAITKEFIQLQSKLPLDRRNMVHTVEKLGMRQTVLDAAKHLDDDWGRAIVERLLTFDDLVAADGTYHRLCYRRLFKLLPTGNKRGYGPANKTEQAMECVYEYLFENSDECQFSLSHLLQQIKGDCIPDVRTAKTHLKKRFGDDIVIVEMGSNKGSVVCFKNTGHRILYDHWYKEQKGDAHHERLRVVKAAAEIIVEDIRTQVYDTSQYPPSDDFFNNVDSVIPESVQLFFETVVLKNKRGLLEAWKKKCASFSHALIAAVRPRSFVSSLLIGIGTYFYRKYGSKHLVNMCAALGFSCSYSAAVQLETSAILRDESSPPIKKGAFIQFVYDNADVNVNTLDGDNTFHEMGGIMCVTPSRAVMPDKNIPRIQNYVPAQNVSSSSEVQIKECFVKKKSGLAAIMLEDLQGTFEIDGEILPSAPDLIWLYGKSLNKQLMPGWNGFMEQVTDGLEFSRSKILFLPFIRAHPTDYNTVFTSLMEASNQSTAHGQKITFVTFDQPLFIKARDIVESGHHPELNSVVVRLGGFHLLLSFMGCIGTIMGGSGLKELLTTIYAGQSVDKILNGHAYSRAVRAHILTNLTLASIVFDEVNMTPVERDEIENLLRGTERSLIMSPEEIDSYQMLKGKFKSALKEIEANGPTSELWVQYFRMTTLIKLFIQAERAGDWNLHLYTVHKMLPFFHAAGHFLYAKSAHLYLQDMMALQDRMDKSEYDMFTKGCFTIRRSDKFWSGLWSDLTIEQKLMRSMKTYGGLTQGRGISDSVLARWTTGMVFMVNICEELESFCRISCPTGEQHVDMRPSRIIRDNNDVEKLKTWFALHPPFPKTDSLLSISSGLLAGPEINCHTAQKIGTEGVMKIVGQMYDKVVIKRKNKVTTLASITSSVKLPDKTRRVAVDPLTIFQRVCIAKQSEQDLQDDFKYELAPYPMSLFNEQGMRKGTKSTLYSAFTPLSSPKPIDSSTNVVLDGGYLLHKVVWQRKTTVQALLVRYITYVRGHFGKNVSIVFDGYPEDATNKNTKTAERLRRYATHSSYELTFEESTVIQIAQEHVLGNENNKRRLITLLCDAFQKEGVEVAVAEEDADREIVMTALSKAAVSDRVVIVGEDVDLLVLLNGLGAEKKNVYLQKSSKGETGFCHYSTTSYNHQTSPGTILFNHAFTGCDTTSAMFGQGKTKITTLLSKNESLTEQVEVFLRPNSTPEVVKESGIKCFVALYGGDITKDTLDYLRYKSFITSTSINLARLPPTEDAAGHHAARCYLQVQKWRGVNLNPTDWGWKLSSQGLIPITTTMDPAPPALLRKISCKCKKGCSGGCSCRKAGLHCSVLCQSCGGQTCNNIPDVEIRWSDDEDDPTTDWAPLPASIETPSSCDPEPGPSKIKRKS